MTLRCPIKSDHLMIEVAEGLFQCPHCGYGPSQTGYRSYWALSNIETTRNIIAATSIRWSRALDCYVMSEISWEVDGSGYKIPQSFNEVGAVILSTKDELNSFPLPVVIRAKGKWDFPEAKPTLKAGMFSSLLGPKEISLTSAPRDKSGGEPSRA
jgi:hypothetical protein